MNQLLLNNFKDHVNIHYSDHDVKTKGICSNLHCSINYLHEILTHEYGYSIMKYVKYFRILKAIELICKGKRKVYGMVGYNSSSVFSKSFLKVTGLNARHFFHFKFTERENIIRAALNAETENPKKVLESIINYVSIKKSILPKGAKRQFEEVWEEKHENIIKAALNVEIENPNKTIEIIINNVSMKPIFSIDAEKSIKKLAY